MSLHANKSVIVTNYLRLVNDTISHIRTSSNKAVVLIDGVLRNGHRNDDINGQIDECLISIIDMTHLLESLCKIDKSE